MWKDIPDVVKTNAEMSFYNGTKLENAYGIYGVSPEKGAVAVVRPDGYIGVIASLVETERLSNYLKGCLREVARANGKHNGTS